MQQFLPQLLLPFLFLLHMQLVLLHSTPVLSVPSRASWEGFWRSHCCSCLSQKPRQHLLLLLLLLLGRLLLLQEQLLLLLLLLLGSSCCRRSF